MQDIDVISSPTSLATADASTSEAALTQEIVKLWRSHVDAQTATKHTREELRVIRKTLGEKLHAVKTVLVRPGRGGEWRKFLAAHGISRPTADRMVRAHEQSLNPEGGKLLTEQIPEPTEAKILTLFAATWKRVEPTLTTPWSRYMFLRCIVSRSGLQSEYCGDGVKVFNPEIAVLPRPSVPAPQVPDADDEDSVF